MEIINPVPTKDEKKEINWKDQKDGTALIQWDPWLGDFADALRKRYARYVDIKKQIEKVEGSLDNFAKGYLRLGFNRVQQNGTWGIQYREWAPAAKRLFLTGDFNGWDRDALECTKDNFGVFSIFLPDTPQGPRIPHQSKVKISLELPSGSREDRIPAWSKFVVQEKEKPVFDAVYWEPPQKYQWKHKSPAVPKSLRIYECHVGMSSQEPKLASYKEFADIVLPQVVELGYNAIQIMGIMEHAYYASFGYQVTSFFAMSSRFGTPEELKALVDRAHELGILVFLDVVHSHASRNVADGLNKFDGTDHCYFHEGGRGYHPIWDSRLFNYGNWEVLRFLLSNARWWIDEYQFDGFRFDGVSSMLYRHHGVNHAFVRGYEEYFKDEWIDEDAIMYLTLVNDMLRNLPIRSPSCQVVTISEDVSGMVGMCRPVEEGGIGFDYRLAMGIPDKWIELLKTTKDEDWKMGDISWTLSNRRYKEKNVAYAESHDQALVGDKTIAFWLMDKEMYTEMSVLNPATPIIDRGMAIHKIIRLITQSLGGDAYLNFMGNEFGHPEWIDFPREGNNNSYHYARRRWDLHADKLLRYHHLREFDKAMNRTEDKYGWLHAEYAYVSLKHEEDKLIAFERAGLFFVFNFHPTKSYTDYRFGIQTPGKYKVILDTDQAEFGGHARVDPSARYFTQTQPWNDRNYSIQIYIPSRTGLVFALDQDDPKTAFVESKTI